jgi:site-specific DNA-methyltransferase (adenine-specific)
MFSYGCCFAMEQIVPRESVNRVRLADALVVSASVPTLAKLPDKRKPLELVDSAPFWLLKGDCLGILETLPDNLIDLVLVDLPYGTTACKWDSIIPLDKLWTQLHRVAKPNAAFVFTAQQPFSWKLCASNPEEFKYELIWEKPNGTNPFQAKHMPMKKHESILVFYRRKPAFNPQMVAGKPYKWNSIRSGGEAGGVKQLKETPIENTGTRYPGSVIRIPQERGIHPTQKPVALMEWLIKSYSDEGATVLDCTMGSGTTGVGCMNTNRKFIGIELSSDYFAKAKSRIESAWRKGVD